MVGRHLAPVNRIYLAHAFLDKRVARFTQHWLAATGAGDILRIPCQARVVNDFLGPKARQKRLGQQAYNVIAFYKMSGAIEEKAAIEISVPSDTQVGTLSDHTLRSHRAIFHQQRVRHAIGKFTVGLVMHFDKGKGQMRFQRINHCTRATITRRTDDL